MKDSCNYLESILANIDTDDYEYQRTKQYNDLVCPGSEGDSEDDSGSDEEDSDSGDDSGDDCNGANWVLLWEYEKGEMQGDDCMVGGEIYGENCDCTDPANYIYDEGRF